MPSFSRLFRSKDSSAAKKNSKAPAAENKGPAKPTWTDAWQRTEVGPEEVQQLLRACTQELKVRGMSIHPLLEGIGILNSLLLVLIIASFLLDSASNPVHVAPIPPELRYCHGPYLHSELLQSVSKKRFAFCWR